MQQWCAASVVLCFVGWFGAAPPAGFAQQHRPSSHASSVAAPARSAGAPAPRILVNGVPVPLSVPARVEHGVLTAPLAPVLRAFGASVSWDARARVLTARGVSGTTLRLAAGRPEVTSSRGRWALPSAPVLRAGRLWGPAAVLWYLGAYVKTHDDGTVDVVSQVTGVAWRGADGGLAVTVSATGPMRADAHLFRSPDRLVVDLRSAVVRLRTPDRRIGRGAVLAVRGAQFNVRPYVTRLVFDLTRPLAFETAAAPGAVVVALGTPAAVRAIVSGVGRPRASTAVVPPAGSSRPGASAAPPTSAGAAHPGASSSSAASDGRSRAGAAPSAAASGGSAPPAGASLPAASGGSSQAAGASSTAASSGASQSSGVPSAAASAGSPSPAGSAGGTPSPASPAAASAAGGGVTAGRAAAAPGGAASSSVAVSTATPGAPEPLALPALPEFADGPGAFHVQAVAYHDAGGTGRLLIRASEPFTYALHRWVYPDRLAIDIPGGVFLDRRRDIEIGSAAVRNVVVQQFGLHPNLTRVLLHLNRKVAYTAEALDGGRTLVVAFGDSGPAQAHAPAVVIDPGHGGSDSGAIGPTGLHEADVVLSIGRLVQAALERQGVRAVLTRTSDTFVSLEDRPDLAQRDRGIVFVSIHANASTDRGIQGTATYYDTPRSRPLAEAVQRNLVQALGEPDRGVRTARFYVIVNTPMPAVLVEAAFITNPREEAMLRDPAAQQRIADGIARGIAEFLAEDSQAAAR